MRTVVVLFNRDLRVHDHPALAEAARRADTVVPLFVVDEGVLAAGFAVPNRAGFLVDCLTDLRTSLRERGADLVVRRGEPVTEALRLADEVGAAAVHASADVSGFARRREERLTREAGGRFEVALFPGVGVVPADEVFTGSGEHYRVFTPYWRAWAAHPWRAVEPVPERLRLPDGVDPGTVPEPTDLVTGSPSPDLAPGGETEARALLNRWAKADLAGYADGHDDLAGDDTSRISPHLHFGTVSALELAERLGPRPGGDPFVRQLCWRDFYYQTTVRVPGDRPRGPAGPGAGPGSRTTRRSRPGPRGGPGCRSWTPACGSCHAGGLDAQPGPPDHRLVPDQAPGHRLAARAWPTSSTGWSTATSPTTPATGSGWRAPATTPGPYRVFNPVRQAERFDPDGDYVRRYVPELAGIAGGAIHEPWLLTGTLDAPDLDSPRPHRGPRGRRRPASARRAGTRSGTGSVVPSGCYGR